MIPILISEPAVEPLTLDDARAWLRLDTQAEDTLLTALIRAARHAVEQATRRALIAQDWRLRLDRWPPNGILPVPLAPVMSLLSVCVIGLDGVASEVPLAAFRLDESFGTRIVFNEPPPAPGRLHGGIEIDLRAGYGATSGAVPPPLLQAMRMLIAHWYEHRGDALHEGSVAHLPAGVAALVVPYRRARLA
jgi:uncharacterized phiE125 gp8 family phage protein